MKRLCCLLLVSLVFLGADPLLFAAGSSPRDEDSTVAVAGRLVDASGQPVAGASASTYWNLKGSRPTAHEAMVADASGAFSGSVQAWRYPVGITAYSADGALAGCALVDEAGLQTIEIVLRPTVSVRAEVTCEGLGKTPDWVNADFRIGGCRLGSADTSDGELAVRLPQGTLEWNLYDSYFSFVNGTEELGPEALEVDLGTIDVPAAFLALNEGKTLPEWTVSDARGVDAEHSSLAAFRGKWLLIEFWGFW